MKKDIISAKIYVPLSPLLIITTDNKRQDANDDTIFNVKKICLQENELHVTYNDDLYKIYSGMPFVIGYTYKEVEKRKPRNIIDRFADWIENDESTARRWLMLLCLAALLIFFGSQLSAQTNRARLVPVSTEVPMRVYMMAVDKEAVRNYNGIDTIRYDNHKYIYHVIERFNATEINDTNMYQSIDDEIIFLNSIKMYNDNFKAAGVAYFLINFTGFIAAPQMNVRTDKYLHFAVGFVAGATVNYIVYKWTGKKWLAFGAGIAASIVLGTGKEIYDYYNGGVSSFSDNFATISGGVDGSGGATIVFGHKEKQKKFINP